MLDFRSGSGAADDTGYNDNPSVRPELNGQPLDETNLGRWCGHLRTRTELLRQACDLDEMSAYVNRGLVMAPNTAVGTTGGPVCTWLGTVAGGGGGTGLVGAMPNPVIIKSVGSPPANLIPEILHTTVGVETLRLTSSKFWLGVQSSRDMADGGRNIFFEWAVGNIGDPLSVTIEGAADPLVGPTAVVISLVNDGMGGCATTYDQLVAAINAAPGNANGEVLLATITGAGDANPLDPAFVAGFTTRIRLYESATYSVGGVDAISFSLSQAGINAVGPFVEGDVLLLDYPTSLARLSAAPTVIRLSADVFSYVGLSAGTPIFIVKDNTLVWFNGVVGPKDIPIELITGSGLRAELANQNTAALGAAGTARIGGSALTGATKTVPVGTLTAQLQDLLDGEMAVTVGATLADFAFIQDAIDALDGIGGVIYVRPGVYAETLVIPNTSRSLRILGASENSVIVQSASPLAVTMSNGDVRFEHITFRGTAAGTRTVTINDDAVGAVAGTSVFFDHCRIEKTATAGGALSNIGYSAPTFVRNCQVIGFSEVNDIAFTRMLSLGRESLTVSDSYFNVFNTLLTMTGGAHASPLLSFVNNHCRLCGYTTGVVPSTLFIGAAGYNTEIVDIRGNKFAPLGAGYECYLAQLYVVAVCDIQSNWFYHGPAAAIAADRYVIEVTGTATSTRVNISENNINRGGSAITSGGILATTGGITISDNYINFDSARTTVYAIYSPTAGCRIEHNTVAMAGAATMSCIVAVDSEIVGNKISMSSAFAQNAIYVPAGGTAETRIHGNIITGVAASNVTGVLADSPAIVSENTITLVRNGVVLGATAGNSIVKSNRVSGATTTVYGIHAGANIAEVVHNDVSIFDVGLYVDGAGVTAAENMISALTVGIRVSHSLFNLGKNHVIVAVATGTRCIDVTATGDLHGIIDDNILFGSDTLNTIGVYLGLAVSYLKICDNEMRGIDTGVEIVNNTSTHLVINNNIIVCNAADGNSTCIKFPAPGAPSIYNCSIIGNHFDGWNLANGYGIDFNAAGTTVIAFGQNHFSSPTRWVNPADAGLGAQLIGMYTTNAAAGISPYYNFSNLP